MFLILSENNQAATQTVAAKIQTLHGKSGEQVSANVVSNSWTEIEVSNSRSNTGPVPVLFLVESLPPHFYLNIAFSQCYCLNVRAGGFGAVSGGTIPGGTISGAVPPGCTASGGWM